MSRDGDGSAGRGKMRLQLELSAERLRELEQLMEETGIATKADLINNALALLTWSVRERNNGNTIASMDEHTGKYKELVMPALEASYRSRPENHRHDDKGFTTKLTKDAPIKK